MVGVPLGKIIGTTVIENKEFLKELLDIEPTVSFVNQQVSQFCFALILVLLKVNAMIFTNSLFVFFSLGIHAKHSESCLPVQSIY